MRVSKLFLLILSVLAAPLGAVIPGSWRILGPDGGSVYDVAYAPGRPQTMYAAVDGAVFRSVDGGASWAYASAGLNGQARVYSLAVDPGDPLTVYAGQDGVYKSVDGGTTWTKKRHDLGVFTVVTPVRGTVYVASVQGLFKSVDGGGTWKLLSRGLPPAYHSTLLVADPRDPNRLYATADDASSGVGRLYRTADGGSSWKRAEQGLPASQAITALAIDPRSPQTLYAGTADSRVYKSRDGGALWRPAGSPQGVGILSLRVDPNRGDVVFAGTNSGLFRSERGGAWTDVSQGLPEAGAVYALAFPPATPGRLYAAVATAGVRRGGVFLSLNGGGSWTLRSMDISALSVSSIAAAPGALWVTANEVLFKSADRGETWARVPVDPLGFVKRVAVDPADPANVYAVLHDDTLWRSRDGGQAWEAAGDPGIAPVRLAFDPRTTPATVYAAGFNGIVKSADGGTTWTRLIDGTFRELAIAPSSPSTLYAAGIVESQTRILRSTDAGTTWIAIEAGLPIYFSSLAIDSRAPDTLYTVAAERAYRTTDGGATWSPVANRFRNKVLQALIFPAAPAALHGAVLFDDVYRLPDGGGFWEPLGASPGHLTFEVLAADPQDPCRIYAGTRERGLLVFTEKGTAECR